MNLYDLNSGQEEGEAELSHYLLLAEKMKKQNDVASPIMTKGEDEEKNESGNNFLDTMKKRECRASMPLSPTTLPLSPRREFFTGDDDDVEEMEMNQWSSTSTRTIHPHHYSILDTQEDLKDHSTHASQSPSPALPPSPLFSPTNDQFKKEEEKQALPFSGTQGERENEKGKRKRGRKNEEGGEGRSRSNERRKEIVIHRQNSRNPSSHPRLRRRRGEGDVEHARNVSKDTNRPLSDDTGMLEDGGESMVSSLLFDSIRFSSSPSQQEENIMSHTLVTPTILSPLPPPISSFSPRPTVGMEEKDEGKGHAVEEGRLRPRYPPRLQCRPFCVASLRHLEEAFDTFEHLRVEEVRATRVELRRLREVASRALVLFPSLVSSLPSLFLSLPPVSHARDHVEEDTSTPLASTPPSSSLKTCVDVSSSSFVVAVQEKDGEGDAAIARLSSPGTLPLRAEVANRVEAVGKPSYQGDALFSSSAMLPMWKELSLQRERQWMSQAVTRWAVQCMQQQWNTYILPWWNDRVQEGFYIPVMRTLHHLTLRIYVCAEHLFGEADRIPCRFLCMERDACPSREQEEKQEGKRSRIEDDYYLTCKRRKREKKKDVEPNFHTGYDVTKRKEEEEEGKGNQSNAHKGGGEWKENSSENSAEEKKEEKRGMRGGSKRALKSNGLGAIPHPSFHPQRCEHFYPNPISSSLSSSVFTPCSIVGGPSQDLCFRVIRRNSRAEALASVLHRLCGDASLLNSATPLPPRIPSPFPSCLLSSSSSSLAPATAACGGPNASLRSHIPAKGETLPSPVGLLVPSAGSGYDRPRRTPGISPVNSKHIASSSISGMRNTSRNLSSSFDSPPLPLRTPLSLPFVQDQPYRILSSINNSTDEKRQSPPPSPPPHVAGVGEGISFSCVACEGERREGRPSPQEQGEQQGEGEEAEEHEQKEEVVVSPSPPSLPSQELLLLTRPACHLVDVLSLWFNVVKENVWKGVREQFRQTFFFFPVLAAYAPAAVPFAGGHSLPSRTTFTSTGASGGTDEEAAPAGGEKCSSSSSASDASHHSRKTHAPTPSLTTCVHPARPRLALFQECLLPLLHRYQWEWVRFAFTSHQRSFQHTHWRENEGNSFFHHHPSPSLRPFISHWTGDAGSSPPPAVASLWIESPTSEKGHRKHALLSPSPSFPTTTTTTSTATTASASRLPSILFSCFSFSSSFSPCLLQQQLALLLCLAYTPQAFVLFCCASLTSPLVRGEKPHGGHCSKDERGNESMDVPCCSSLLPPLSCRSDDDASPRFSSFASFSSPSSLLSITDRSKNDTKGRGGEKSKGKPCKMEEDGGKMKKDEKREEVSLQGFPSLHLLSSVWDLLNYVVFVHHYFNDSYRKPWGPSGVEERIAYSAAVPDHADANPNNSIRKNPERRRAIQLSRFLPSMINVPLPHGEGGQQWKKQTYKEEVKMEAKTKNDKHKAMRYYRLTHPHQDTEEEEEESDGNQRWSWWKEEEEDHLTLPFPEIPPTSWKRQVNILQQQQADRHSRWEDGVHAFMQRWGCRRRRYSLPSLPPSLLETCRMVQDEEFSCLFHPHSTPDLSSALSPLHTSAFPDVPLLPSGSLEDPRLHQEKEKKEVKTSSLPLINMLIQNKDIHVISSEATGIPFPSCLPMRSQKEPAFALTKAERVPQDLAALPPPLCLVQNASFHAWVKGGNTGKNDYESHGDTPSTKVVKKGTVWMASKDEEGEEEKRGERAVQTCAEGRAEERSPLSPISTAPAPPLADYRLPHPRAHFCITSSVAVSPPAQAILLQQVRELEQRGYPWWWRSPSGANTSSRDRRGITVEKDVGLSEDKKVFFWLGKLFDFVAGEETKEKEGWSQLIFPSPGRSLSLSVPPSPCAHTQCTSRTAFISSTQPTTPTTTTAPTLLLSHGKWDACTSCLMMKNREEEKGEETAMNTFAILSRKIFSHAPLLFLLRHPHFYSERKKA